jgi:YHS domain-containing protein
MMRRRLRPPVQIASGLVLALVGAALIGLAAVRGDDAPSREIPPAFAPFEYLVGSWKGQGISRDDPAQRFRGWTETHAWAWTFSGGKPTAMSVNFQGSKLFKTAAFTFDAARDRYQLKVEAVAPAGATIVYEGGLDASRKLLTLDRTGVKSGDPAERLTLRANSNFIRYTLVVERKPANRVQFAPAIEVGVTKEGETFAAGSTAVERRKCVVTGGAATLTVAYQGREFPICCTGCRDEFLETPEKYVKKASLATEAAAKNMPAKPAPSRVRGADDAFSGDVEEPSAKPAKSMDKPSASASKSKEKAEAEEESAPKSKPAAKPADRAASLLKIAQNLEKAGKFAAALKNYREIVKSFPDAPAAKTAKERIKALGDQ